MHWFLFLALFRPIDNEGLTIDGYEMGTRERCIKQKEILIEDLKIKKITYMMGCMKGDL